MHRTHSSCLGVFAELHFCICKKPHLQYFYKFGDASCATTSTFHCRLRADSPSPQESHPAGRADTRPPPLGPGRPRRLLSRGAAPAAGPSGGASRERREGVAKARANAQAQRSGARRLPGYGASASHRTSRAVASPLTRGRCSIIRALGATRGRWRRCSLPSG